MKQMIVDINATEFQIVFQKYVLLSGSYLFDNRDEERSICGHMNKSCFQIWQNIGIRNFKMLTHGVLCGTIKEDGTLYYSFKKRIDGFIFLIGMAIFSIIMGILACQNTDNIMLMLPFILIAFFNVFLASYHSKKDQRQLLGVLNHIIYEVSNEKQ